MDTFSIVQLLDCAVDGEKKRGEAVVLYILALTPLFLLHFAPSQNIDMIVW